MKKKLSENIEKKQPEKNDNKKTDDKKTDSKKKGKNSSEKTSNIVALVIFFIILIGVILFINSILNPKPDFQDEYNGYKFYKDNYGYWNVIIKTTIGDSPVPFYFHPADLEKFEYDQKINAGLLMVQKNNGSVVIVFDKKFANPNLTDTQSPVIAAVEIGKITSKVFGMETDPAFNEEIPGVEDMKVFNCSMANKKIYVFEFQLGETGEESRVYSKGLCAIIRVSKPEDTVMFADLISYKLLGIMK